MLFHDRRDIEPPAFNLIAYDAESRNELFDTDVSRVYDRLVDTLAAVKDNDEDMAYEREVVRRLIRKGGYQHRVQKYYRFFKRIHRCICIYASLRIGDSLSSIHGSIPVERGHSKVVYLPSKHMFEHLLVRVTSCHSVLSQCIQFILHEIGLLNAQIRAGLFPRTMSIYIACLSRIGLYAWTMVNKYKDLYNTCYPLLHHLKEPALSWLPVDYTLESKLHTNVIKPNTSDPKSKASDDEGDMSKSDRPIEREMDFTGEMDDVLETLQINIGKLSKKEEDIKADQEKKAEEAKSGEVTISRNKMKKINKKNKKIMEAAMRDVQPEQEAVIAAADEVLTPKEEERRWIGRLEACKDMHTVYERFEAFVARSGNGRADKLGVAKLAKIEKLFSSARSNRAEVAEAKAKKIATIHVRRHYATMNK